MAGKNSIPDSRTWEESFSLVLLKKIDGVCYHVLFITVWMLYRILEEVNIAQGQVM